MLPRASFSTPGRAAALVWLLCGLVLSGCAGLNPAPHPSEKAQYVYRVGPGDVLAIGVWKEPGLEERDVTVTPDGNITFPLVSGSIEVEDSTLAEIAESLRADLLAVLQDPVVTVTLRESRSAQVQVLGEIKNQGRVPYRDGLSAIQAIGEAGGPDWATAKMGSIRVVRGALVDPILFEIDGKNLLEAGEKDLYLEPGDIVVVPAKHVTRFARYIHQLLAPVAVAAGAAGTAARIGPAGL